MTQPRVTQVHVPLRQSSRQKQTPAVDAGKTNLPPILQLQTSPGQLVSSVPGQPAKGLSLQHESPDFPDVPGGESMEFVEKMIRGLRRIAQREDNA